jgi:NTE family protein
MKAYAILDGGGVKGAALSGSLSAAADNQIEFQGYAGSSAGAIVALLAAVGFTPPEIKDIMLDEIKFTDFLDDNGVELNKLKQTSAEVSSAWSNKNRLIATLKTAWRIWMRREVLRRIVHHLGLYTASKLRAFLDTKITQKLGNAPIEGFTFRFLANAGCPPLKIVAADLRKRAPHVYSLQNSAGTSVIDAVRASMSYPFVFQPVQFYDSYQVDGGLSSNLPLSVFEEERRSNSVPVMAFDLEASKTTALASYGVRQFCGDLLATALESGDVMMREALSGVYHVRIAIPEGIDTLDFSLSRERRDALFNAGYTQTSQYIKKIVPQWTQANNEIEWLQATHAPAKIVQPVLRAAAKEIESRTGAENVRAHVMLPTGKGQRVVTYQFNMDHDPDSDLMLDVEAGCTGRTWTEKKPTFADLEEARMTYASKWKMTREQQNKIREDRRAMCSFPIFEKSKIKYGEEWRIIGTLSFDSKSELSVWLANEASTKNIVDIGLTWSDIVGKLIS